MRAINVYHLFYVPIILFMSIDSYDDVDAKIRRDVERVTRELGVFNESN
jgi:hypothetical protein